MKRGGIGRRVDEKGEGTNHGEIRWRKREAATPVAFEGDDDSFCKEQILIGQGGAYLQPGKREAQRRRKKEGTEDLGRGTKKRAMGLKHP